MQRKTLKTSQMSKNVSMRTTLTNTANGERLQKEFIVVERKKDQLDWTDISAIIGGSSELPMRLIAGFLVTFLEGGGQ